MKRILLLFTIVTGILVAQPTISISEFCYNTDSTMDSGDWLELHNYGSSPVDISNFRLRDGSTLGLYLVPSGTIIPAGGYMVFCSDITKFDGVYSITNRMGPLGYSLSNSADSIRIFDNTNTLVTKLGYTDSVPWPQGADGYGRTLESLSDLGNPNDPLNWRTGCVLGSPGTSFSPCTNEKLVVSEINYNSMLTADAGDWFELRNIGTTPINIGGYRFRDGNLSNVYQFAIGTIINPQQSLVVCQNMTLFNSRHPSVTNKVGPFVFSLSGTGEAIRLYNASDKIIFSVFYDDSGAGWPNSADGNGYTLEADTNFVASRDVNSPDEWFDGCPEGSPGEKYNPDCTIGLDDLANQMIEIYPNPTTNLINITSIESIDKVQLFDVSGKLLMEVMNQNQLNIESFSSGIYLLRINQGGIENNIKIIKE